MKRPSVTNCAPLILVCLCLLMSVAEAGRDPEAWDVLPQIDGFVFGKTSIGLVSRDHDYFVLDTQAGTFREISESEFKRQFSGPVQRGAEVVNDTGIGSQIRLRTSGPRIFTVTNAYCSEGEDITHQFSLNGKPVKDFVDPCYSVSAAEEFGDQLWLGTRADGENGDEPAEGIIIQSGDGRKKIGQISTKNGLTGDLVRTIRLNPIDSLIWVATNQGINAVAKNLKIAQSIYFYQDFDPTTGRPTVMISPVAKPSPPIVELAKQLRLADYKSFYRTLKTIPPAAIAKLTSGLQGLYMPGNALIGREAFAPIEVNKLVPFFIEASHAADAMTKNASLAALCATNDPRAIARFVELRAAPQGQGGYESSYVPACLDKYALFKLLPRDNANELANKLKADTQAALNAISGERKNTAASGQLTQLVVQNAISLKGMSDSSGMDLVNEYFKKSDGNDRDAFFYDYVGLTMTYENDVWPAMVEGLQKFPSILTERGCMYFDMRWDSMPRRFDKAYARAILTAVTHAMSEQWHAGHVRAPPEFWSSLVQTCAGAFKSQLDDPATKKAFMEEVYGTLSPSEKKVADQMARGNQPSTLDN